MNIIWRSKSISFGEPRKAAPQSDVAMDEFAQSLRVNQRLTARNSCDDGFVVMKIAHLTARNRNSEVVSMREKSGRGRERQRETPGARCGSFNGLFCTSGAVGSSLRAGCWA